MCIVLDHAIKQVLEVVMIMGVLIGFFVHDGVLNWASLRSKSTASRTGYSGWQQWNPQSHISLASVRVIRRLLVDSPHQSRSAASAIIRTLSSMCLEFNTFTYPGYFSALINNIEITMRHYPMVCISQVSARAEILAKDTNNTSSTEVSMSGHIDAYLKGKGVNQNWYHFDYFFSKISTD